MKNIIYTDSSGYNQQRNIIELPHEDFIIKKRLNLFRMPNAFYFKLFKKSNSFFLNSHYDSFTRKSLHHFFNTISFGEAPWITSFETLLPRWGQVPEWLELKGVQLLASENCKKLIAVSECAREIQTDYLNRFPDYKAEILKKTITLHPPQKALFNSYSEKVLDPDFIIFTFVGADFFRKGGKEILIAFDKLINLKAPIKLNIVSTLQYGDYATKTTIDDRALAMDIIKKHPNRIKHYPKISNDEVLKLLKTSHVGLLPTYADTYGYSVLEAQAVGCPVISTDIRALPEINNNNCGWIINVPKDRLNNALLRTEQEINEFSSIIEEKLSVIISDICNKPNMIANKATEALERIKAKHNPSMNSHILSELYASAKGLNL